MPDDEKMVLTNAVLADLGVGLASLDGIRTSPEAFRPYKFDDENETVWLIAENSEAISQALKAYDRAKKLLAVQHGVSDGMKITAENAEKVGEFLKAMGDLDEKTVEVVGLKKISRARLKVGKGDKCNPIPPSVLAKLMPILEN